MANISVESSDNSDMDSNDFDSALDQSALYIEGIVADPYRYILILNWNITCISFRDDPVCAQDDNIAEVCDKRIVHIF